MASNTTYADIRSVLEAEREELRGQLADLGPGSSTGDHYDPNFADSSQVTAERGEAEALASRLRETLVDVERALAKIEDGTFGICEGCGEPLQPARLEAMPAARRCVSCASKR
jgi:RNA polymerase-binding transcription factor DksA